MEARGFSRISGDSQRILALRLIVLLVARSSNFVRAHRSRTFRQKRPTLREARPDVPVLNFLSVILSQVSTSLRPASHSVQRTFKEKLNKAKEGSVTFGRFAVACVACRFGLGSVDASAVFARSLVDFSDCRSSCTS